MSNIVLPDGIDRLTEIFEDSLILFRTFEIVLVRRSNLYFSLKNCETELDLKCKVLEWCSRDSYKTEPYDSDCDNRRYHEYVSERVNKFLGTNFSQKDFERIYTYLGNCCNHSRTIRFINSNYDMKILYDSEV